MKPWSPQAFEARYRDDADPWRFATSSYELERYRVTLDALSRPHYRRGFEPGCSIGILTEALAKRCFQLEATEVSATALAQAAIRCQRFSHVSLQQQDLAAATLHGHFDLIVLSELGYYFAAPQLAVIAHQLARHLAPGGELIAVHWLGHSSDHQLHGDEVHRVLADSLSLTPTLQARYDGFRLERWQAQEHAS